MQLKEVRKPKGPMTPSDDPEIVVKGHRIKGYYDSRDQYYEHDECCNKWFKLDY